METLKLDKAMPPRPRWALPAPNWWGWFWLLGGLLLLILGGWFWVAIQPMRDVSTSGAALEAALAPGAERSALIAAVAQLEVVAAAQPDSVLTLRRLAQGYLALNRPPDALRVLEKAAALQPDSPLLDHERTRIQAIMQQRDPAVWAALGHDAASLAGLGDQHLAVGDQEALLWYRAAQGLDPNSVPGLRIELAGALAGDPRAIETGLVHPLEQGRVQIGAEELRWLVDRPNSNAGFGQTLGYNSGGGTITKIWWTGPVATLVRVDEPGTYRFMAQVRQVAPAPVVMALGLGNQQIAHFHLTKGDDSAAIISTDVQLERGTHMLTVWFLNDGIVNGVNRDAQVEWVELEQLP
ncbi:MAG: tetratricopeptide repeat protein [Oscillochloridaceae bacterium umkhey_bin13]